MRTRTLSVVLVASIGIAGLVQPASASSSMTQRAFSLVNAERRSRGLPALRWNERLASVARSHSAAMARDGRLRHNPRLASQVDGWSELGENVGTGSNVDIVHDAFMASASHRDNILRRSYTEVGMAVVVDDEGVVWVTQDFMRPANASSQSVAKKRVASKRQVSRPRARAQAGTVRRPPVRSAPPVERPAAPVQHRAPVPARMHTVVVPF